MGNSPSSSPPLPSSPCSRSTASSSPSRASLAADNDDLHRAPTPETQEEDGEGKGTVTQAEAQAYQRGLADGYRQAINTEQLRCPPECKNKGVKYQWITYGWDHKEDFPVEAWKSHATQERVRVWGPCPGCGAIISGEAVRSVARPRIDCVWVACNCSHDHGAGPGRGCGRHLAVCHKGGF